MVRHPLRVVRRGRQLVVVLGPALRKAVDRYYPGYSLPPFGDYHPWDQYWELRGHSVSFACVGDFDGNGLPDAALYLMQPRRVPSRRIGPGRVRRRRWLFVAFHQTREGDFQPVLIQRRWDPEFWVNEYTEAYNRFTDYHMSRKPRGSKLTYPTGRYSVGTMRLRRDGISEISDDGEAQTVYYLHRGRYRWVSIVEP